MRAFFKRITITKADLEAHLQQCRDLSEDETYEICIPDIKGSSYTYTEKIRKNTGHIKSSLPWGMNKRNKKYLPQSLFAVINKSGVNAFATELFNIPVIGLHVDSIAEIMYYSTLFVGLSFEEDFDISAYKRSNIFISDSGVSITAEESLLGYKDERILSYMMAEAALRFMVLHEIGHHANGHVSAKNEKAGFVLLLADDNSDSEQEIEADIYAAEKLAEEYDLILKGIKKSRKSIKLFKPDEFELLALNILIGAMVLPYSLLYAPDSFKITEENYKSSIAYREFFALINLGLKLFNNNECKNAVIKSLISNQNEDVEPTISNEELEEIKKKRDIRFDKFMLYILKNIFPSFKQMYYKINEISDRDYYLNNYIKVLEFMRNEN